MATGSAHTYTGAGYHHVVLLKGFAPHTKVYYQAGDATDGWTRVYNVVTARAAGDTSPFTVTVMGDMGISNSAATLASMLDMANRTDFVWHLGDQSCACVGGLLL